jgi:hypothetical protein
MTPLAALEKLHALREGLQPNSAPNGKPAL